MFNSKMIGTNSAGSIGPLPPATNDAQYMVASTSSGALYMSIDYGSTWFLRNQFASATPFSYLKISSNGQRIAVQQGSALYLSADAGLTFTFNRNVSNAVMSSNGNWLYYSNGTNVFPSNNFGLSWQNTSQPAATSVRTGYSGSEVQAWAVYTTAYRYSTNNWSTTVSRSGFKGGAFYMSENSYKSSSPSGSGIYKKDSYDGAWALGSGVTGLTSNIYYNHDGTNSMANASGTFYFTTNNWSSATGWGGFPSGTTSIAGGAYVSGSSGYVIFNATDGVYRSTTGVKQDIYWYPKKLSLTGVTKVDVNKIR